MQNQPETFTREATGLFVRQLFFYQFFNNFPTLSLWKINIFDILNIGDFLLDFCYIAKYWNPDQIQHLAGSV